MTNQRGGSTPKALLALLLAGALAIAIAMLDREPAAPPASRRPPSAQNPDPSTPPAQRDAASPSGSVAAAFARHARGAFVEDGGRVARLLADDREGSRHQRFLVRVDGGPTILIAHNVDLAERVSPLQVGDAVRFRGEYVWNAKGGVVHWTHGDPDARRAGGWIEVAGRKYR
jgi:uncharacterized protein DUF3465